jgi:hypothetical protein
VSKSSTAGNLILPEPGTPPVGLVPLGRTAPEPLHSNAELLLRRLRFYLDLLEAGYRQALDPDPLSLSLRPERIALGIDLPELDAVPLWSARGRGDTICVPFVEFILGQIAETLDGLAAEVAAADPAGTSDLEEARRAVLRTLDETGAAGEAAPPLPRLGDVFVPAGVLEALCGPGGSLPQAARRCEATLRGRVRAAEH